MENINIVNREKRQIPEVLDGYANKLDEIIDMSSVLLEKYLKKKVIGDDSLVPILFFRNALEYADSISILIKNSSIEPVKAINRILLENLLQLEYLLDEDTTKKSYAFLVWTIKQELKIYKKIDKNSPQNVDFKRKISNDKLINDVSFFDDIPVKVAIKKYSEMLKIDGYREASIEYEKTKSKTKFSIHWYSLYSGPKNISELAEKLNRSAHYEIFYRNMSNNIHGTDIFKNKLVSKQDDGLSYLLKLRNPHEVDKVLKDTLNFLLSMNLIFLEKLVPEETESFGVWYLSFQEFFINLGKKEDFIVIK